MRLEKQALLGGSTGEKKQGESDFQSPDGQRPQPVKHCLVLLFGTKLFITHFHWLNTVSSSSKMLFFHPTKYIFLRFWELALVQSKCLFHSKSWFLAFMNELSERTQKKRNYFTLLLSIGNYCKSSLPPWKHYLHCLSRMHFAELKFQHLS